MCPGPHQNQGRCWRCETGLSPPVKYFTDRSKAIFRGSFVLFMPCVFYAFASVHCSLVGHAWKGLTSWLLFVMLFVFLSLSHVVSCVRCGT